MKKTKENNKIPLLASEAGRLSTALRKAAQNGATELVKSLLAQGAHTTVSWGRGENALMLAAREGHEACVRELAPFSDKTAQESFGYTALMLAAEAGHEGCVEALLEGSPLNECCRHDEFTALELALMEGHVRIAQILLKAGARLTERVKSGGSLVCEIIDNGEEDQTIEVLEWVIEQGGAHFARTQDLLGRSPLQWALLKCDEMCARLLFPHADLAVRDTAGRTALSFCVDVVPVARAVLLARLIAPGSDSTSIDNDGFTVLMRAARRGEPELVEVLCDVEALNIRDEMGRSALDWAKDKNHAAAHEVLRSRMLAQSERAELSSAECVRDKFKDSSPRL